MTFNRQSTKWASTVSLYIGLTFLVILAISHKEKAQPEMQLLNTLEFVKVIQVKAKLWFKL